MLLMSRQKKEESESRGGDQRRGKRGRSEVLRLPLQQQNRHATACLSAVPVSTCDQVHGCLCDRRSSGKADGKWDRHIVCHAMQCTVSQCLP